MESEVSAPKLMPKYSKRMRDTFKRINPYHVSCMYKAPFEDHALDILRIVDEEDKENSFLLDPLQEHITHSLLYGSIEDAQRKHQIECGDAKNDTSRNILSDQHKWLDEKDGTMFSGCQWFDGGTKTCSSNLRLEMFFRSIAINTRDDAPKREDALCTDLSPWHSCLSKEKNCTSNVGHEESEVKDEIISGRAHNHSAGSSNSLKSDLVSSRNPYGPWPLNVDTSEFGARNRPCVASKVPRTTKNINESQIRDQKMCSIVGSASRSHAPNAKSSITYPFAHMQAHKGHMQQYRETVTKQNLRHALLHCAHRYYALKGRSGKTLPRVFVECADVREGACIKPSLKLSNYNFDMNSGLSCQPVEVDHNASLQSIAPIPISPIMGMQSPEELSSYEKAIQTRNESPQMAESPKENQPLLATLARRCRNTKVTRSRPSIPSNCKGMVCPTAVETGPLHNVVAVKRAQAGQCLNPKPIKLSFVPGNALSTSSPSLSPRSTT